MSECKIVDTWKNRLRKTWNSLRGKPYDTLELGLSIVECKYCQHRGDTSYRDHLLVTAGTRAAYMYYVGYISLPKNAELGSPEMGAFIAKAVDTYLRLPDETDFGVFIENALREEYRREK